MTYAPIIVFAFNRLDALKSTIASLLTNPEAKESPLYVFVDGPREGKNGETAMVEKVRHYVDSITGFKEVSRFYSERNKGLGPSIIEGTTNIINQYGKAIIVEDDLVANQNFLAFLNQGLDKYAHNSDVFSICAYTNQIQTPHDYAPDAYCCTRSSSWGWATWADRWNTIDWKLEPWQNYTNHARKFNKWGGSDCWHMLNDWHKGKNHSWAIRFCFAQYLQNKVSIFPTKSLVQNNGFDGDGTNCKKWSRFRYELDNTNKTDFIWPETTMVEQTFHKQAMHYHCLQLRLWSKIMYLIHR